MQKNIYREAECDTIKFCIHFFFWFFSSHDCHNIFCHSHRSYVHIENEKQKVLTANTEIIFGHVISYYYSHRMIEMMREFFFISPLRKTRKTFILMFWLVIFRIHKNKEKKNNLNKYRRLS